MTLLDERRPGQPEAAEATPEFEAAAVKAKSRRGFLMALPAYAYLLLFFAVPLVIVFVYSFATRNSFGGTDLARTQATKKTFCRIAGEKTQETHRLFGAENDAAWMLATSHTYPAVHHDEELLGNISAFE